MLTNELPFKATNHIELLKMIETKKFKIENYEDTNHQWSQP